MATISLVEGAPDGAGVLTVANAQIDVREGPQETDNESLIAQARLFSSWFAVEVPAAETVTVPADYDPSDPHQNPAADHLSIYGSAAARDAAAANDLAIQEDHFGDEPPYAIHRQQPTVADAVKQTFTSQGIETEPQVADAADDAPADEPEASTEPDQAQTPAAGTGSGAWTAPTTTSGDDS